MAQIWWMGVLLDAHTHTHFGHCGSKESNPQNVSLFFFLLLPSVTQRVQVWWWSSWWRFCVYGCLGVGRPQVYSIQGCNSNTPFPSFSLVRRSNKRIKMPPTDIKWLLGRSIECSGEPTVGSCCCCCLERNDNSFRRLDKNETTTTTRCAHRLPIPFLVSVDLCSTVSATVTCHSYYPMVIVLFFESS